LFAELAAGLADPPPADGNIRVESSEALAKPSSDPCDIAASRRGVPRSPRFEMLEMRHLRVDQEPGRHCERRPLRFSGQALDAERPAEPHRTAKNLRRKLEQTGQQSVEVETVFGLGYRLRMIAS
jgi:hypothetical protein